ncbi:MAG: hypothetical protein COV30_00020 [Candidatus Yanofskybacteria bacterium CG10_big_fil_rev_8_21_14_0_10_37_15]|uniref:Uncharacterized protein n=1 Tax=Candidatus Yanofskybacteria bacterium CG10_big_fil_rev_8_21_14_0_10_37_15 TaxID=1975097 RepID=A0A2H0R6K5_9BACT|nr:MAG: hypothetical protein COV30_00020 [Candidatus Yanofskybacteria bacterium CG10_big_fil_rev_8_21_14_0_10_37_15]
MNLKEFFSQHKNIFIAVVALIFLISEIVFLSYDYFNKQSADILKTTSRLSDEPLCDNHSEIEEFEKPISIIWTAKIDGCLASCEGASFTRVPEENIHPRFAGYYSKELKEEIKINDQIFKIYGDWIGINADHPFTVFDNKCVPIVNVHKIEKIKEIDNK